MMKNFALQLGMLALIGSVAGAACTSDDASDPPASGGSSGTGGSSAGKGGAGGSTSGKAGTGGSSGGTAGKGGSGGSAGTSVGGSSGSGGAGSGGTGTGGTSGESGGSGEGGAQGGADSGGEGGADSTAACNTVVNTGGEVSEEEMSGTLPTVTGGTLPDGTYKLTRRQDWDGTCNCIEQRVFVFSQGASHFEVVTRSDGGADNRGSGDVTFGSDQITLTFTCGPAEYVGQSMTMGYSVILGSPVVYQTWDTNNGHLQLETYEQQ